MITFLAIKTKLTLWITNGAGNLDHLAKVFLLGIKNSL